MDVDTLVTAAVNVDAKLDLAGQEYHDGNRHFNSYGGWRGNRLLGCLLPLRVLTSGALQLIWQG